MRSQRHLRLPGDEIIAGADLQTTRTILIAAPADAVWPWLQQLGQERGGFYSFTWLENAFGSQIRNASEIVDEWQHLAPGDTVRLHPRLGLTVDYIDPGRAIVLHGEGTDLGPPFEFTWSFVLEPAGERHARLTVRERYGFRRRGAQLVARTASAISSFMTEKMLRGIKLRAERAAARSA